MDSTDEAPGFESFSDADPTAQGPDDKVKWGCFSCGKYLGEQGAGGSFDLSFGYGSGYDGTQDICGWICDECVTQKHGFLRVRRDTKAEHGTYWANLNYASLNEHEETKGHVANLDYFGRRQMPWGYDHNGESRKTQGDRQYEWLTSAERSRIESWLFQENETIDRDLIVKLLQALMESEATCALESSRRWRSESHALGRARNQAERLTAEELAQLRTREHENMTPCDWRRLWEHTEWNERHFREQEERLSQQAHELKALRAQNEALQKRMRLP